MNPRKRTRKNKGFTLLEVLLVMAILIILMSLVGAGYFTYFANSQEDACQLQMQTQLDIANAEAKAATPRSRLLHRGHAENAHL